MNNSFGRIESKFDGFVDWLVAIILYLSLLPYFIWNAEPYYNFIITLPLFLLSFRNLKIKQQYVVSTVIFTLLAIWGAICGGSNIFGIAMTTFSAIIFLVDESFLIRVYNKFRFIFIATLFLSLIVFLLVSFGVHLPYHVVPPPPRNTIDFDYFIYPFYACPSVDDWRGLGINRFNALFDEPGVVGTISFVILFVEKFNLKRIGNIVLMVSGILSFSLFFYIAVFMYLIYYILFERTRLITKILVGSVALLLLFYSTGNELFEGYIGKRLLWEASAKTISGDNRSTDELKKYVYEIRGTSDFFFGVPEAVPRFQSSASIEKQILSYGFITVALFFVFFAIYSHRYLKTTKEWLLFLLIFGTIMYNRPAMFSYPRLFLYCVIIFSWSSSYKQSFIALQSQRYLKSPINK